MTLTADHRHIYGADAAQARVPIKLCSKRRSNSGQTPVKRRSNSGQTPVKRRSNAGQTPAKRRPNAGQTRRRSPPAPRLKGPARLGLPCVPEQVKTNPKMVKNGQSGQNRLKMVKTSPLRSSPPPPLHRLILNQNHSRPFKAIKNRSKPFKNHPRPPAVPQGPRRAQNRSGH